MLHFNKQTKKDDCYRYSVYQGLSSDEFRIWLKIIRNSTKNIEFEIQIQVEFGFEIRIRPSSTVEFGPVCTYGRIWL